MKNLKQKLSTAVATLSIAALPMAAHANGQGFDAAAVGAQVSSVIMGFVALISAIGLAAITVILAIQGFRMAFGMIKSVK